MLLPGLGGSLKSASICRNRQRTDTEKVANRDVCQQLIGLQVSYRVELMARPALTALVSVSVSRRADLAAQLQQSHAPVLESHEWLGEPVFAQAKARAIVPSEQ